VTHNDFVYRSLGASYLAPARDIGGMVHGRFFKRSLNYWAGAFQHDGDNARSKKIEGGGRTLAARVTGTPFRWLSSLGGIEIGSAFAISELSDDSFRPNGLRGRTVMTQDTFYDSVYVKGHRRRWEADADWTAGPVSARAEFTWVSDDRLSQGIGNEDLPDARARAWYVSGTWVLTGEDKKRPLKAAQPFVQGGIGAIEVAARYERMWFDSTPVGQDAPFRNPRSETIYPSGDRALTIGLNWTLNRFAKIQVNGIREQVDDPQRNPVPNGAAFWSRVIRFQFVL
jgi:phosphate-selective porin